MAAVGDAGHESGTPRRGETAAEKILVEAREEVAPFVDYAIERALSLKQTLQGITDSSIQIAGSRIAEIRSTSSAHLNQTLEELRTVKEKYDELEDVFFGKIKEGVFAAYTHPALSCGIAVGLGILVPRNSRRYLYHNTLRLFMREESMISRANDEMKNLQESINKIKQHIDLWENSAKNAQEEFERGRTKLRQSGLQIQNAIHSVRQIEKKARGLKELLGDLPAQNAANLQKQVSSLAKEAKKERSALSAVVSKITNYGIPI
ncbi:hypothetical protein QJS10_CPA10g00895 [Acorus calamus]|uniref:Uncharacterized protein n=1 Tax=Acorus calamus TaxID=4465 RepID=A0AAV9DWX9_ACOCL|nr:hypothetical protein QJS10_CPA10g00895 [Acorus calamus]